MKCVAANQRDANLWRYAVPTPLPLNIIETPLHLQKAQIDIHHDVGMAYRYIPSKLIIIRNKFFFLFIGRKPTMWPANNSLQIMVCSSAMPSNSVWLQIIFCSSIKETVVFSFLQSVLHENGRLLRFPMIKQSLNSVIAKYRDLSVSCRSIIMICSPQTNHDIVLKLVR